MSDSDDDSKDAAKRLAFLAACEENAKAVAQAKQAAYSGQGGQYSYAHNPQAAASLQDWLAYGASARAQLGGDATVTAGTPLAFAQGAYYPAQGTVEPVTHLFEGAPKNEAKNAPCGTAVVRPGRVEGFVLTGAHATTAVNFVTCLGCLRALIAKGGTR